MIHIYPARYEELNLSVSGALCERYCVPVPRRGHETRVVATVAAVVLRALVFERPSRCITCRGTRSGTIDLRRKSSEYEGRRGAADLLRIDHGAAVKNG